MQRSAEQIKLIDARTPVDTQIFSEDPWYDLALDRQLELTQELVRENVAYHLERNCHFRRYVEQASGQTRVPELAEIPLVSTRIFKFMELNTAPLHAIEQWYRSSGTSGLPSRVPRDRLSLERLVGSVKGSVGLIEDWHEDDLSVINLGPGRSEVTDVWFQYVMSLIEASYESRSIIPSSNERLAELVARLQGVLKVKPSVVLVGPPFYVLTLCEYLRDQSIRIEGRKGLTVLTAGGWKSQVRRSIAREPFRQLVADVLRLPGTDQVRDAFNQVELNSVFFECQAHEKHVPPWVYVEARDPKTARPAAQGTLGVLSYMDASCTAFPCFILTEDVGVVRRGTCACGRSGTRVEVQRRLESRAAAGCALKMEQIHEAAVST